MQQGQPAKALEVLTQGLALDVDRPPFLVKLGEAHLELKQYDDAEKVLKEAVAPARRRPARAVQPGARLRAARQRRCGARRLRGRGGEESRQLRRPVQPRQAAAEGGPAARGDDTVPGRRGRAAAVRRGLPLPRQGAARRRQPPGRGARRRPRGCRSRPTARSPRSATTCSPTSTAAWAARTRRRARWRAPARWSAVDDRAT